MTLKIWHTGDIHVGLRFGRYAKLQQQLITARLDVLERMLLEANHRQCQLFIVAGDLFDKVRMSTTDIRKVTALLGTFAGECVAVLPGNHDYDDGQGELWNSFTQYASERIVVLNQYQPYDLADYGLCSVLYPAFCDSRHSAEHRLSWIPALKERPQAKWHIGIGHGALDALSPDMEGKYFNMSLGELQATQLDLWCLGHTHKPYPSDQHIRDNRVFNCGTPEPDGLDCKHMGHAWYLVLDEDKYVKAELVHTGKYRFIDRKIKVQSVDELEQIEKELLGETPGLRAVRLALEGHLDTEAWESRGEHYHLLSEALGHFELDEGDLSLRISADVIDKEFTKGSFPHKLLHRLNEQGDDEAVQVAYALIKEASP